MLTIREFESTANVAFRSVEELFHPFDIEPDIEQREFNVDRVYRLFIRDVLRSKVGHTPQSVYIDAVIPEHRRLSGMERRGRKHLIGNGVEEISSVRLVHVGNEEMLIKVMRWWSLLCVSNKQSFSTLVAEQDAFVAQTQIRKCGLTPRFIYNIQQLVELDIPVKQELSDGRKTWFML